MVALRELQSTDQCPNEDQYNDLEVAVNSNIANSAHDNRLVITG